MGCFKLQVDRQRNTVGSCAAHHICGPNSSGKSTVLQSLLLVSQTLSHKVGSRSVVLNGALTRLGEFDDLRSYGGEYDQITIGWECHPTEDAQTAIIENTPLSGPVFAYVGVSTRSRKCPADCPSMRILEAQSAMSPSFSRSSSCSRCPLWSSPRTTQTGTMN